MATPICPSLFFAMYSPPAPRLDITPAAATLKYAQFPGKLDNTFTSEDIDYTQHYRVKLITHYNQEASQTNI